MSNLYAKAVENNGGGLSLYVFSSLTNNEVFVCYDYEYRSLALLDDMQALAEHDSVDGWVGNEMDNEWYQSFNDLYWINNINVVVAEVKDGVIVVHPEKMGKAASDAFAPLLPTDND